MGSFICQISEIDWLVSRKIGVYGNREGSEREGKIVIFTNMKKGDQIIQSIIEDLIGMRKGDIVFFHVINTAERESSIHGVYRVSEEPFYNDKTELWKSSPYLVYPYRFCFEPHPQHTELCKYDASILVSEFYRSIENRDIRSILTLEREVRGAAHAVKTITSEDAEEIVKLLYKNFSSRHLEKPIDFKPKKMRMEPLRNHIRRVGEIEFAIKALVSYELGKRNPNLIQHIPACRSADYDFLIESFIGQTMRRPTDILCISSRDSEKVVTILEGKTARADMDDLIQSLKYQELFKLRNIDRGSLTYKMSICLLAQRFHRELVNYTSIRNDVIRWEEVILLKYSPTQNGKNATFTTEMLAKPSILAMPKTYPKIETHQLLSKISSNPSGLYPILGKKIPPKTIIELRSSKENVSILQKYYRYNGQKILLGHILIYLIRKKCVLEDFIDFMNKTHEEANKFQGDFMAVDPVVVAENYDNLTKFFIEKYNKYESRARHQPISAYTFSKT